MSGFAGTVLSGLGVLRAPPSGAVDDSSATVGNSSMQSDFTGLPTRKPFKKSTTRPIPGLNSFRRPRTTTTVRTIRARPLLAEQSESPASDDDELQQQASVPTLGSVRANFQTVLASRKKSESVDEGGKADASPQFVAAELRKLIGRVCQDSEEKYNVLKERDELLNKARVKNFSVKASRVVGTLKEMCPEKERYSRQMQRTVNFYECVNGEFIPDKAIKDYARSAADQELPLPHELRPIETLEMTMNYLISEIVVDIPTDDVDLIRWYEFLWTRTRAIRKDITQEQLVDARVVALIEKCARFHAFAAYKLAPLDATSFDQRMNIENLAKCLQSLRHCYEDLAKKKIFCPDEAEFRSYDILLNLQDSNVFNQASHYTPEVQNNPLIRNSLDIAVAFHNDNASRFFQLVASNRTTFLQACLCSTHFQAIRGRLLLQTKNALQSPPTAFLADLTSYFFYDNQENCLKFLQANGCVIKESRPERTIISLENCAIRAGEDLPSVKLVECKINCTLAKLLANADVPKVQLPQSTNSFDDRGVYCRDPIIEEYFKSIGSEPPAPLPVWGLQQATRNPFAPDVSRAGGAGEPNKHVFRGYPDDPREKVPAIRFVPQIKSSFLSKPDVPGTSGFSQKPPESIFGTFDPKSAASGKSLPISFGRPSEPIPGLPKKKVSFAENLEQVQQIEQPPSIPQPSPGPSKEELERLKNEAEEQKLRLIMHAKATKKAAAEILVTAVVERAVNSLVAKQVDDTVRRFKEVRKHLKKVTKTASKDASHAIISSIVQKISLQVSIVIGEQAAKLRQIGDRIHRMRVMARVSRYIKCWKWAVRRKQEKRAVETLKDALRVTEISPRVQISSVRLPTPPMKQVDISEWDEVVAKVNRRRLLARKYFRIWREAVPIARWKRKTRPMAIFGGDVETTGPPLEIEKNILEREKRQQTVLIEMCKQLFGPPVKRKRASIVEPTPPVEKKRNRHSTPLLATTTRSGGESQGRNGFFATPGVVISPIVQANGGVLRH